MPTNYKVYDVLRVLVDCDCLWRPRPDRNHTADFVCI